MKSLILYSTTHGATKNCAELLAKKLDFETTIINVKENNQIELDSFDIILLGSSVYAGMIQGDMKKFCKNNQEKLAKKKHAIFLCCMYGNEKTDQIDLNFGDLSKDIIAKGYFGAQLNFKKLSFFEGFLTRVVAKTSNDVNTISTEAISKFANDINSIAYLTKK